MKKLLVTIAAFVALNQLALADVWVNGYIKKSGTFVQPHYRSNPDRNPYNNWGFPGNTNPYTGKTAGGEPYAYLNRYSKSVTIPQSGILSPRNNWDCILNTDDFYNTIISLDSSTNYEW